MAKSTNVITLQTLREWYRNKSSRLLTGEEESELQQYLDSKSKIGLTAYSIIKAVCDYEYAKYKLQFTQKEFNLYNDELIPYRRLFLSTDKTPANWLKTEEEIIRLSINNIFELGKEVFEEWLKPESTRGGLIPYGQIKTAVHNILARRQNAN